MVLMLFKVYARTNTFRTKMKKKTFNVFAKYFGNTMFIMSGSFDTVNNIFQLFDHIWKTNLLVKATELTEKQETENEVETVENYRQKGQRSEQRD